MATADLEMCPSARFFVTSLMLAAVGCGGGGGAASDAATAGTGGRGGDAGAGGATGGAGAGGGATASRVFVTSAKYTGALSGLTGGDAKCQALADAASLGGRWLAWLGDGTNGPATRFVHSDAPYSLVGGNVIARNWPDLIDGTIEVPINHDERGAALPASDDMIVWTAVFHTGGNPTPVNCMGWTDASDSLVPTGLASATDTGWTVTAPYYCSEMHRVYCFEQ
jgi:hypothetical protein